nr:uncharacterized protein LOC111509671 [Leptinotarsa decemlineata]
MYSSPAVRLYTSENTDSLIQRKPGANQISRKPFVDRSVNSKTPEISKFVKSKLQFAKDAAGLEKASHNDFACKEIPNISISPQNDDLSAEDYIFSGKVVEDVSEDLWPDLHLGREGIINILRNYCQLGDTPPPSPTSDCFDIDPINIDPLFFSLPDDNMHASPVVWEECCENVDVPKIESDDDLDSSLG